MHTCMYIHVVFGRSLSQIYITRLLNRPWSLLPFQAYQMRIKQAIMSPSEMKITIHFNVIFPESMLKRNGVFSKWLSSTRYHELFREQTQSNCRTIYSVYKFYCLWRSLKSLPN